jgi:hypothetical protein
MATYTDAYGTWTYTAITPTTGRITAWTDVISPGTTIVNETFTSGAPPSGWTSTGVTVTNPGGRNVIVPTVSGWTVTPANAYISTTFTAVNGNEDFRLTATIGFTSSASQLCMGYVGTANGNANLIHYAGIYDAWATSDALGTWAVTGATGSPNYYGTSGTITIDITRVGGVTTYTTDGYVRRVATGDTSAFDRVIFCSQKHPSNPAYTSMIIYDISLTKNMTVASGVISVPVDDGAGVTFTEFGAAVFSGKGLTGCIIPSNMTGLYTSLFQNCHSLTSLQINTNITTVSNSLCRGCNSLTTVTLPNTVSLIDQYAFYGCSSLTSINWPTSLVTLEQYSFRYSGLTSITLPTGLVYIYSSVFADNTQLTSVVIPNTVALISNSAFYNCTSLTSINLGTGVMTIGGYTFYGCSALTNITLPASLTSVGMLCFAYSGLTSFTSGVGLTTLGDSICERCLSMTNVIITDNITSINANSFAYCYALTTVRIGAGVTAIQGAAFWECTAISSISFYGSSVPTLGSSWLQYSAAERGHAYYGSDFPDTGEYLDSVLLMGEYLPEFTYTISSGTVTLISYNGIRTEVFIPRLIEGYPVLEMSDDIFNNSAGHVVTSVSIPPSITIIGDRAFYDCSVLEYIGFGEYDTPTVGTDWITNTSTEILGHAVQGSLFPDPGEYFHGLLMGEYVPGRYSDWRMEYSTGAVIPITYDYTS